MTSVDPFAQLEALTVALIHGRGGDLMEVACRRELFAEDQLALDGVAAGPQLAATLPEWRLPNLEAAPSTGLGRLAGRSSGLASDVVTLNREHRILDGILVMHHGLQVCPRRVSDLA